MDDDDGDEGDVHDDGDDDDSAQIRCRREHEPEPLVSTNRRCKAFFPPPCIALNLWEFLS